MTYHQIFTKKKYNGWNRYIHEIAHKALVQNFVAKFAEVEMRF